MMGNRFQEDPCNKPILCFQLTEMMFSMTAEGEEYFMFTQVEKYLISSPNPTYTCRPQKVLVGGRGRRNLLNPSAI